MHPLEKKITNLVRSQKLFTPETGIILAVSGGPDSMAMLHLLAACRQVFSCTLTVAYVDHGLRPEPEMEEEKRLVAEQASLLGLAAHFGKAEVRDHARRCKLSIEDAARRLRYAYLQKIAAKEDADRIAVAHTADDQAEEMVLRLIRGTGRKGLSGMLMLRDDLIIRPLLLTGKNEVLSYLRDKNIPYVQDSSNLNPKYLRNRIRHCLLPLVETDYNPNIRQVLRNTASILQAEEEYFDEHAAAVFKDCLADNGKKENRLTTSIVNKQHPAIQRRVIEKMLCSLSVSPSFLTIENIRRFAQVPDQGGELHLPRGLRVSREGDALRFNFPKGKTSWRGSARKEEEAGLRTAWSYQISQPGSLAIDEIGRIVSLSVAEVLSPEKLRTEKDDFLDLEVVSFPLTCRALRQGDRFQPLGSPGSKKVTDYLRDRKISREERRLIPVLESNGRIIALPGVNIAHHCRIRETTSSMLRISIR